MTTHNALVTTHRLTVSSPPYVSCLRTSCIAGLGLTACATASCLSHMPGLYAAANARYGTLVPAIIKVFWERA